LLALLHCPEDPGNMLRSTGKEKKKKNKNKNTTLKFKLIKNRQKY